MRCTSLAAFLAVPLVLIVTTGTYAYPPEQCTFGSHVPPRWLNLWSRTMQDGPLFNYGPYYGYPPFAPYGPWNAYLQYNPWYYGYNAGGGGAGGGKHCCGGNRDLSGHGALCNGSSHALWANGGWHHGCATCGHGGLFTGFGGWGHVSGCKNCSAGTAASVPTAFNPATTDPVSRYSGAGNPIEFASYYTGLPTLVPEGR
jgi:hypothetical protein